MQIGYRYFRGRDQKQIVGRGPIGIVFELRQLSCPDHDLATDEQWRLDLDVPVFAGMQLQHEVDQPARQARARAHQHRKSRSRKLGTTRQIEDPETLGDFPVRFPACGRRRAPAAQNRRLFRHFGQRRIGDEQGLRFERGLDLPQLRFERGDTLAQLAARDRGRFR